MIEQLYIAANVRINRNGVFYNGELLPITPQTDLSKFAKDIYTFLQLRYPKFYKMDLMSKYGFLASELLLQNEQIDENTSLIFANKTSSLHTDKQYQESIQNQHQFHPSPSIFVYTLPNIVLGEICIRHQIKGENVFFILDTFNSKTYFDSVYSQFNLNKSKSFIISWIEIEDPGFNVFFAYVKNQIQPKNITFSIDNLNTLNRPFNMEATINSLKNDLIKHLNLEDISPDDIDADAPLFGDGLGLDSIDALEIIVLLDRQYGIKVKDQASGQKAMQSIRTLAQFIEDNK
jgi:3-oxoacyl-[acyl-carrier-protein] synthase-1